MGLKSPSPGRLESNDTRRKPSSTSYLPLPNEPNETVGILILPKLSTAWDQVSLVRFGPAFSAICFSSDSSLQRSSMPTYVSTRFGAPVPS